MREKFNGLNGAGEKMSKSCMSALGHQHWAAVLETTFAHFQNVSFEVTQSSCSVKQKAGFVTWKEITNLSLDGALVTRTKASKRGNRSHSSRLD